MKRHSTDYVMDVIGLSVAAIYSALAIIILMTLDII